jgi:signal peptidase I
MLSGSHDSRYWGLLPEDFLVGKVALILKLKDPETGWFRWKRFVKRIRKIKNKKIQHIF